MMLYNCEVRQKSGDSAAVILQYVHKIINNNKSPESWTAAEKNNPVVFDKQVQTYISLTLAVVKNKESGKVISGGNFDFKDNSGHGYYLELKYKENDDAVKEVVRCIREECKFSCITGKTSASCFSSDQSAEDGMKEQIMQKICDTLEKNLSRLKIP
jgi:hypothetical protein